MAAVNVNANLMHTSSDMFTTRDMHDDDHPSRLSRSTVILARAFGPWFAIDTTCAPYFSQPFLLAPDWLGLVRPRQSRWRYVTWRGLSMGSWRCAQRKARCWRAAI